MEAAASRPSLPALPAAIEVCASDRNWVRPTADEMAETVWRDNRYRGVGGEVTPAMRAFHAAHFFLFTTVTGSGASHTLNLSGLSYDAPYPVAGQLCGAGSDGDQALIELRALAIWLIGYEAVAATIDDDESVTVVVEPHVPPNQGYQIVRVARPQSAMLRIRFVLPSGEEIARAEGTNLFGPVPKPGPELHTTGGLLAQGAYDLGMAPSFE
jgi:hypothetical protein